MKKKLSFLALLSSFVFLIVLSISIFNKNLITDTNSQLASIVGPLISNVKVSKITLNGATISWTTDIASTSKVETKKYLTSTWVLATDDPSNITEHSIDVSGLLANTKYSYRITSCDNLNNCKNLTSSTKFTTTNNTTDIESPTTPTNLSVSAITNTTAILNWTASTDNIAVTGYNLYKRDANGNTTKKILGNVTTYNISGLTAGQERSYWLEAFDAVGNISVTSNEVTFTTTGGTVSTDTISPSSPTGLSSSNITQTSATISWTASTDNVGVTGYDIYKNGIFVNSVTNTTTSLAGLNANTTYSITLKAKDAAGNISSASSALSVTTLSSIIIPPTDTQAPSAPTLTLLSKTDTTVIMQWTTSTDNVAVAGYHIYKNGTLISSTSTETSITASGLTPATSYSFTVKAFDTATTANISSASNILSVTTDALHDNISPSAPSNLNYSNLKPNSVDISWTASTDNVGVVEYQVFYQVNNSGPTLAGGTISSTSINVSGLTENTNYKFTISSKDASNNYSPLSAQLSVTTPQDIPPAPTNLVLISKTHNSASMQWTAPVISGDLSPVNYYNIYVNGNLIGTTTSTETSITASGLTPATSYSFTVKTQNALGHLSVYSSNSLIVTTDATPDTQAPSAPTGLNAPTAEITTSSINLYWTASTDNVGVVEYQVFKNNSATPITGTITSTSVPITGLSPATTYSFIVKAKDAAGNISSASNILSVTTDGTTCPNTVTNPADARDVWAWHGNNLLITPNSTFQTNFFNYADSHKIQTIYLNADADFINGNYVNIKDFLNKAKSHCMEVEALGGAKNWIVTPGNPYLNPAGFTTDTGSALTTDPKNLRVSNVGLTTATLSWDAPVNTTGIVGYNVYKSSERAIENSTGKTIFTGTKINTSLITGTTYNATFKEGEQPIVMVKRVTTGNVDSKYESSNFLVFGMYSNEATEFATAVKNLNNSITGTNAKFSSVQYDVEPYDITNVDGYYPYWELNDANYTTLQSSTAIANALIDMLQNVKAVTGNSVKVTFAPPRWFDVTASLTPFSRTGVGVTNKNAMQYMFDQVDILAVQDYVTTPANIQRDASGELNYAATTGKKVKVGILLDASNPSTSSYFGSTCTKLNNDIQSAYNLMTATEKSALAGFAIEQYDTLVGYRANTPSSWTAMCP